MLHDLSPDGEIDEPPPFLKSWDRVYAAVLTYLLILVLLLYLATRWFTV